MNGNVTKRVTARIIATLLLTAVLALLPPILYHKLIYTEFYMDDAAKEIATQFLGATRWIHAGGIIAIWLLNLVFFSINQGKNDCGRQLYGRTTLQNVLNVLLIILGVAAMFGYRLALSAETWSGVYFSLASSSKAIVWMPYYLFGICGLFLWRFCRKAAPATNCPVTWPIAKGIDRSMTLAERKR